jgi:ribosomal-protein-alanine N-acetyltransferase
LIGVNESLAADELLIAPIMLTPPYPYQLRPMELADSQDVLEIEAQAFPTPMKASLLKHELTENRIAHYQVLLRSPEDAPSQMVGYSGYWMIADEIHISTIAVAPAWRGRGLGELLLLNMLLMGNQQAAQMATLEVRQGNLVAQALYSKYRFEVVGERRRYYHDTGEDALLMTAAPFDAAYYQDLEKKRARLFARLKSEA